MKKREQSILIIDDRKAHLSMLKYSVSQLYPKTRITSIHETQDLDTKVQCLLDAGLTCIICDYDLGSCTALDVFKQIPAEKRPPFIVVTSHNDPAIKDMCTQSGVHGFLEKCSDPEAFQDALGASLAPYQ